MLMSASTGKPDQLATLARRVGPGCHSIVAQQLSYVMAQAERS